MYIDNRNPSRKLVVRSFIKSLDNLLSELLTQDVSVDYVISCLRVFLKIAKAMKKEGYGHITLREDGSEAGS